MGWIITIEGQPLKEPHEIWGCEAACRRFAEKVDRLGGGQVKVEVVHVGQDPDPLVERAIARRMLRRIRREDARYWSKLQQHPILGRYINKILAEN